MITNLRIDLRFKLYLVGDAEVGAVAGALAGALALAAGGAALGPGPIRGGY